LTLKFALEAADVRPKAPRILDVARGLNNCRFRPAQTRRKHKLSECSHAATTPNNSTHMQKKWTLRFRNTSTDTRNYFRKQCW
jgi:hypothetical protein